MNDVILLILISLAVASTSMTISKSTLFSPLRIWIKNKDELCCELISCPYCVSHWISLFISLLIDITVTNSWLNIYIIMFSIIALSAFWCGLIYKSFDVMVDFDG